MERNLEPVLCGCGCGEYAKVDKRRNRVSKYLPGHNAKSSHPMLGKHHTPEARAKLASYTGSRASSYKHGMANTPTYWTWKSMHGRCYDTDNASYPLYRARGITVCERWHDFTNFVADMGARPSEDYSLDRIDPAKGYEPGNCRWLTKSENCRLGGINGANMRWHS